MSQDSVATEHEKQEFELYYNSMMDLFATRGWTNLVSDLTQNFSNINQVHVTKDVEDLNFRKGQLNILGTVINLEAQIQSLRDQFDEPSEAE